MSSAEVCDLSVCYKARPTTRRNDTPCPSTSSSFPPPSRAALRERGGNTSKETNEKEIKDGFTPSEKREEEEERMDGVKSKLKTYLMPPLDNPEHEKRRKNAISAHNNRIRKKRESQILQEEVKRLKMDNERLRQLRSDAEIDCQVWREKNDDLLFMISELQQEKHSLQVALQTQQERLNFFREHVNLINKTIEDNSTRRLLTALLDKSNTTTHTPHTLYYTSTPPAAVSPSPSPTITPVYARLSSPPLSLGTFAHLEGYVSPPPSTSPKSCSSV